MQTPPRLNWLDPGDPFPPLDQALGVGTLAPGLLAGGGALDVVTLTQAYRQCIFPWYSPGQPILWWSPDPRMVLDVGRFKLHRSLRKTLDKFRHQPSCEVRFDTAFEKVITACATAPREGQSGTWIVPDMVQAYIRLHGAGVAHSVETWINGELVGGLYCVGLGRAVFGESMFSRVTDGSKIALGALVSFCRQHGIDRIDCQQNTLHLASLGATEMRRSDFAGHVAEQSRQPAPAWRFDPVYWNQLLPTEPRDAP